MLFFFPTLQVGVARFSSDALLLLLLPSLLRFHLSALLPRFHLSALLPLLAHRCLPLLAATGTPSIPQTASLFLEFFAFMYCFC